MTSVNFYESSADSAIRAACKLLDKVYLAGYRAVVRTADNESMHIIDKELWTFAQKSFIPHATCIDPHPELQPVYITTNEENPNQADICVLVGTVSGIFNKFDKTLVIFDAKDLDTSAKAQDCYNKLNLPSNVVNYYTQNTKGAWSPRSDNHGSH